MNLKQFQYVLVLADKGNFSRAAEELNVSQPSLSQYIKRLENDLGVILFDRSNSDVSLTEAGKVYIDAGKKILDTEHQMQNKFSDLNNNLSGSIVVGIAPTRCQYIMPEVVKRFGEQYPGMNLVIEERFLGNIVEDAEHGIFDLCVVTLPVDSDIFSYRLMMKEEVVLAVPKTLDCCKSFEQKAGPMDDRLYPVIDIKLLDSIPYVCLTDTQPTQMQLNKFSTQLGFSVKRAVQCMSIVSQFSMAKSGIGAALIPSSLAKYSMTDTLEYFSVLQDIPYRDMAVIYRKQQHLTKAMISLIDIMTSV